MSFICNLFKAPPTIIELLKKCCKYMSLKLKERGITPISLEYFKWDMKTSPDPNIFYVHWYMKLNKQYVLAYPYNRNMPVLEGDYAPIEVLTADENSDIFRELKLAMTCDKEN